MDDQQPTTEAAGGQSELTGVLAADSSTVAFEYEACMRAMDAAWVPRTDPTFGAIYSIWGRAQWMAANGTKLTGREITPD